MPIYENAEKVTEVAADLFSLCFQDPEAGPKFKKMNLVLKYNLSDPGAEIYVDTGKCEVVGGEYDRKPDIELTTDGDVLHDFLSKKISISDALAAKKIRVKGPIFKVMKMIPLLSKAFDNYPEIVKKHGI